MSCLNLTMAEIDDRSSPNICCLGTNAVGVAISVVIAYKCPDINVVVIDVDPDKIYLWNSKKTPAREPGLDDLLKKCQNRNLIFTTDNTTAIQQADVIIVSINIPMEKRGNVEAPDLTGLEDAARLIATEATKNKIIVEKSNVPVGCTDFLKLILATNKNKKLKFEVLSNPEFYPPGSAIQSLLFPERVIIGSDSTKRGATAAKFLASIYSQWVPPDRIVTMKSWSSEITKLSIHAMMNQTLSSLNTISMICEEMGGDVKNVIKALGDSLLGSEPQSPSIGLGDGLLLREIKCLIYLCETQKLHEAADYWRQVLEINYLQQRRFFIKVLRSFFLVVKNKKIALWGFSFKNDVEQVMGSSVTYVCRGLLKEGARLCIYDPTLTRKQVLDNLEMSETEIEPRSVTLVSSLTKAAYRANCIICCVHLEDYEKLDFVAIHKDMAKPAFVFDAGNYLPHEVLVNIGFVVKTIGKNYKSEHQKIFNGLEPVKQEKNVFNLP